tara:strand:- start:557 stop:754 length:198 start_codon:yes stop_codon:yes gene_type:complete
MSKLKGVSNLVKAMDDAIQRVTGIKPVKRKSRSKNKNKKKDKDSLKKYSKGGGVAVQGTKFKGSY